MNNFQEILDVLEKKLVKDLLVGGYIDHRNTPKQFKLNLMAIYFAFEENLFLKIASVDQYDKLKITLEKNIECDPELANYEEFCLCSVSEFFINIYRRSVRIFSLTLLVDDDVDWNQGLAKYAIFYLEGKDCLVLDPCNLFGVSIKKFPGESEQLRKQLHISQDYREVAWDFVQMRREKEIQQQNQRYSSS